MKKANNTLIIKYAPLLLILAGFVLAAIPHLSLPHYWDESWSYATAVQLMYEKGPTLLPGIVDVEATRGHPLFFYAAAASWMKLFGATLISKHSFALFISTLLLIAIYEVGYKLCNIRAAVLATLLFASQIFFFVQSSMLLPEIMVALLFFIAIYFFICEKYTALAVSLSLLFLTKESGLVLGLVLGLIFIASLFNKEYLRSRKIKIFSALLIPALIIICFFIIQKIHYGWFFFPEHIGLIDTNLNDFSARFQDALFVIFIGEKRQWLWIIIAALTVFYTIKKKDYKWLLFVWAIAMIFAFRYIPLDLFRKPIMTLIFIMYLLFVAAKYRAVIFSNKIQNKFTIIAVLFSIAYLIFCSVNFYTARYLMPILLLSLIAFAYWLDTILKYLSIKIYAPFALVVAALSIQSYKNNNNIGDTGLGMYNALKVQQGIINFLADQNAQHQQISMASFQQKINMQNAACGFISSNQASFQNIRWEIDALSKYIVFDNIEPDSRFETIKNNKNYKLVYQIKKDNVWGMIFAKIEN